MDATDICNLALDILKEAPITSIEDPRATARWFKRNFPTARDAALSVADWNFAMDRALLPADAIAPIFGWEKSYTLPGTCIRLSAITYEGHDEGRNVRHRVERGRILTNETGPLPIRFVSRTEAYDSYHPLFVEALSARMAFRMAHWMTGKTSYQEVAAGILKQAMSDAWLADAIEGDIPRPADNDWVDARSGVQY